MASQEKTESPTPQRRRKAREQGQVARSAELNMAVGLVAGAVVLRLYGGTLTEGLRTLMVQYFQLGTGRDMTVESVQGLFASTGMSLIGLTFPMFGTLMVAGVLSTVVQGGVVLSTRPLKPNLNKLNPLQNFSRLIWSTRSLVELSKAVLKLTIIAFVVYEGMKDRFIELASLSALSLPDAATLLSGVIFDMVFRAVVATAVLALLDYGYQRWSFERTLRMTREELREEMKESEVDPRVRSRLKKQQAEVSRHRMMQEVPTASVVIINPTHLAVAVRYEPNVTPAPLVVAKGQRAVAERIKAIAREHGVPLVENKSLAQALFRAVEVGQEIPVQFYRAVAEILAYVYRLPGRSGSRAEAMAT